MCSSTDKAVAASDVALMNADTAATVTQQQDAALTFGEQQSVLNSLNAKMSYMAANPLGYTPQELHLMTTSVNENTSNAAKAAIGSAAAFGAAHGSADVGGGATGEIAGEIGSQAAQAKAGQLNQISTANQQLKQQNYWKAISGLSAVGSDFGGSTGTSLSAESGLSGAATGAGEGAVKADLAGTQKVAGMINAIGGLASSATGLGDLFPRGGGSGGSSGQALSDMFDIAAG